MVQWSHPNRKDGCFVKKYMILVLALALLLTACGGDIGESTRQIREPERFTRGEIADAMKAVERYFDRHFDGCTLHTIVYDEAETQRETALAVENYGEVTIILKTDFWVDETGGDGSWNPETMYRNYTWTLTKTFFGWKIQDWGYA